jgi:hypothetical protein
LSLKSGAAPFQKAGQAREGGGVLKRGQCVGRARPELRLTCWLRGKLPESCPAVPESDNPVGRAEGRGIRTKIDQE